ncbi:putative membrane-anchored protein [Melghirimyces profundicolus]|uniref:Putative membrane-anchored protein n=1 Tax=Melghirimyces profundicolus TaxID=1242148 RepID=A0A2T6B7Z3_9BACL|nr:putative cytokinetic ring protein SteA [Melghirimyces profundicolus]PTX52187.1 putative membrane-anchored protein [Melghirimyces profundicolus]
MIHRSISSRKRICHGTAAVDSKTKRLIHRIRPGQIAVINHVDLDEVAAEALIKSRVKGVVNAALSIGGSYPTRGPGRLLQAGIPLLDGVGEEVMEWVNEGDPLCLDGNRLYRKRSGGPWTEVASGCRMTREIWLERMKEAAKNFEGTLDSFVDNTLRYADRERPMLNRPLPVPVLTTPIRGKNAVVVVRGGGHEEDLGAVRSFVRERNPVLFGVDGGADALLEQGFQPDIILGDMDSVTDRALMSGAELIVHAYPDGRAPGLKRVECLGLTAHVLPYPGTSEDVAMLLAHQKGAERIVMLGSHSNTVDFLEKGRKGMASTLLARMKVGPRLVDAKGVSYLYSGSERPVTGGLLVLLSASTVPVVAYASVNPRFVQVVKLLWLNLKIFFSWV